MNDNGDAKVGIQFLIRHRSTYPTDVLAVQQVSMYIHKASNAFYPALGRCIMQRSVIIIVSENHM